MLGYKQVDPEPNPAPPATTTGLDNPTYIIGVCILTRPVDGLLAYLVATIAHVLSSTQWIYTLQCTAHLPGKMQF